MVVSVILRRVLGSSWLPMIAALLGILLILADRNVSAGDLAKFVAFLALTVALPGVFTWRLLLAHLHAGEADSPTWLEDLSLGTIFGFGVQLPVYLLGVWINIPLLFLVLPVVVIVLSLATAFGRRTWTLPTRQVDVRVSWSLAAIMLYGVAWLGRYIWPLHPLTIPAYRTPRVDETFHEALISELVNRFPPQIPYLLGTPLNYHWFAHAQMAADHWATGLASPEMLIELMPAALLALTVLGLAAVALRLTGRSLAAVVAPGLLVAGGFCLMGPHYDAGAITEPYLSSRFVSSPTQAYGFMMALPAIMLILEVLRPDRKPHPLTWVTLALALLALSGSKATFMPIFVCGGIGLVLVQLLLTHRFDKRAVGLAGLLVAAAVFAQLVILGGSTGALALDPFRTVQTALAKQHIPVSHGTELAMTVTLLIGWLLYGAGVFGLLRNKLWRDPRTVFMVICIPAGVSVAFLFFRSGLSQLWFQRSVAELVVLLSAWGLTQLVPSPVPQRLGLYLAGLAAGAGLAAYLVSAYAERGNGVVIKATEAEVVATALAPFLVVAVYFLGRLVLGAAHRPRPGPVMLLAVLLGLGLTHVYSLAYDTVSQRSEHHLPPPKPQFAPGGVDAATWIADHSGRYDIVATNAHCRLPDTALCDNRNFWVSAYTQRRVVIEGWGYTTITNAGYSDTARNQNIPNPYPERLKINDAAFENPSPTTVNRLVNTYGVKFLFVDKQYPADVPGMKALKPLLHKKFQNHNYVVFKVAPK
ncbi:MAG: hypothetical protein QOI51_764 [Nocardioidaceae bacterium]|nr:hypothetical protein [Nocardioidaceae bacterium]